METEPCWYFVGGERRDGIPTNIRGDLSYIWGDLTNVWGDLSNVRGDLSNIRGNLSGVRGDLSGVTGDLSGVRGDMTNRIISVGPIGSRKAYTVAYKNAENNIMIKCGCFHDSFDAWVAQYRETYGNNKHGIAYAAAAEFITAYAAAYWS